MALSWRRPTLDTRFHIDMGWWEGQRRDIRVYLRDMLCNECREMVQSYGMDARIDAVDETTGEVSRVDAIMHSLRTCCGLQSDYVGPNTPIIEAIFRTFILNDNQPLSVRELHEQLNRRPPETLLRMLTAGEVYLGLRPIRE